MGSVKGDGLRTIGGKVDPDEKECQSEEIGGWCFSSMCLGSTTYVRYLMALSESVSMRNWMLKFGNVHVFKFVDGDVIDNTTNIGCKN